MRASLQRGSHFIFNYVLVGFHIASSTLWDLYNNVQNEIEQVFYLKLAWEPSVAQGTTHSYSRRLPIFTGKLTFRC